MPARYWRPRWPAALLLQLLGTKMLAATAAAPRMVRARALDRARSSLSVSSYEVRRKSPYDCCICSAKPA